MLVFTPLNSQQPEPCHVYSDYEKTEELNGTMQVTFSVPKAAENSVAFSVLDYETAVEDEDGNVYIVKQISSNHVSKTVTAIHKYFNLDDHYFYETIGGSFTVSTLFNRLLQGTGFTATFDAAVADRPIMLSNFGDDNLLPLIEQAAAAAGVDRYITGASSIHIADANGYDTDVVFQYGNNIKTLEYEVDASNIKTVIKGKSEKLANDVIYRSAAAASFGDRVAKPITDNDVDTVQGMTELLATELLGQDQPEITISLDVLTLDAQVGDNVLLLHEPLGLDIYTRVMAKTTLRNYTASSITIGNTGKATISDLIADQVAETKEAARLFRSRIDQTDDRITLEVEEIDKSISTLEIKADQITTSVVDLETDLSSRITQTAGSIRTELTDVENALNNTITQTASAIRGELTSSVTTINGKVATNTQNINSLQITANSLTSTISSQNTTISNLGTRVNTAESKISQHSDEIDLRVKTVDYTGDAIIGQINLSSTTATIKAKNINLVGAVSVLSDITGKLGTITAGNINIYEDMKIGNKLYLNGEAGAGIYFDRFGARGKMYSNGNNLVIYSDAFQLDSLYGIDVYGGMRIDDHDIVTSRTAGLSLGYSSGTGRLYVTLNGTDIGAISLD